MEEEIWKVYKDTTNRINGHLYEVSNQGRAKIDGKLFDFSWQKSKNYKYYQFGGTFLHRVIAIVFIPNPDNKPCVDHINGDRFDNRVENLKWVTHKENMANPLTKQKNLDFRKSTHYLDSLRSSLKKLTGSKNHMYGKHLSEDTKRKQSEKRRRYYCKELTPEQQEIYISIDSAKERKAYKIKCLNER